MCIGDGVYAYRNRVCMYRNGVCAYWPPKIKPSLRDTSFCSARAVYFLSSCQLAAAMMIKEENE